MSEKIELIDEQHETWWQRSRYIRDRLARKVISMVSVGTLGAVPLAITVFNDRPDEHNLKIASINVIEGEVTHEDNVCPPESQVAIVQIPGVGNTKIGEHAAKVTEKIFGPRYDGLCNAALRKGENGYTATYYAELFHEFVEQNHLDSVVLFAHSFGGITAVDIINVYSRLYVESTVKFAVIFFSAPAGAETLPISSRIDAETLKRTPPSTGVVKVQTYGGTALQEGIDLFSKQTWDDAANNAADTPAISTKEDCGRLLEGMNRLSPGALERVALYEYIGDKDDMVILNDRAPGDIENASGRKMDAVRFINYPNNKLGKHAALWWSDYIEVHREAVAGAVADAQNKLGFRDKQRSIDTNTGLPAKNIYRVV